jgi:hypothetical protein
MCLSDSLCVSIPTILYEAKLIEIVSQVIMMRNISGRSLKGIHRCKMVEKDTRFCPEGKLQILKTRVYAKANQLAEITLYVDVARKKSSAKPYGAFGENTLGCLLLFENDGKCWFTAPEPLGFTVPKPNFKGDFRYVVAQGPEQLLKDFLHEYILRNL